MLWLRDHDASKNGLELAPSTSWHWPLVSKKAKKRKESKCTSPLSSFKVHTSSNLPSLAITPVNKHGKYGSYFIHAYGHIGDVKCYHIELTISLTHFQRVCMNIWMIRQQFIIIINVGYSMAIVSAIPLHKTQWGDVKLWQCGLMIEISLSWRWQCLMWQLAQIWISSPSCSSFKSHASYIQQ